MDERGANIGTAPSARLVAELIDRSGLSQAELARRAGIPRSVVNVYLHGRREPGADALIRLAAAAGFDLAPTHREPPVDAERAGKILVQVLELAEALPFRPRAQMQFPPLAERLAEASVSELIDKLFAVHDALAAAFLPHAFGGAIALAYCVEEPRGTRDLDVNIFSDAADASRVLAALPEGVVVSEGDVAAVGRDGQTRLFWDGVPIDVFLNNLPLHEEVSDAVIWVPLEGRQVPVLDCASLAVFKSLFDRTKDWADLEAIAVASPEDIEAAARTVRDLVGEDDGAYRRLAALSAANPGAGSRGRIATEPGLSA